MLQLAISIKRKKMIKGKSKQHKTVFKEIFENLNKTNHIDHFIFGPMKMRQ